jgi:hypothetical protein
MTLTTTVSRVTYPGTGGTGPFALSFRIFSSADLLVTKRSAAGVETTLALTTDYTVDSTLSNVTTVAVVAVGDSLVIRRAPAITQPVSIRNQGAYFPATIEDEFDRLTMQLQSHQDLLDRSLKFSETEPTVLPTIQSVAAGRYFRVNAAGTGVETVAAVSDPGTYTPSAPGTTARSVTSKLGDQISDKDFGTVVNGSTDDYLATKAAIQASADNQTGVRFVRGIRQIGTAIITTGVYYLSLIGDGYSYLRWAGTTGKSMIKLLGTTALDGMRRIFIDGMWFIMNDATSTILEIGNPDDANFGAMISRSAFQGPNAQGVLGNSEWDEVLWFHNYFVSCGKGVYLKKSPTVIPSSNHTFLSNYFQNGTDWGVDSERSALLNFIANVHQSNGSKGVRVDRQTAMLYLGNYHELHPSDSVGLSINPTNADPSGGGGGMLVGGNIFNINNGGASVGVIIGAVGKGFRLLANQFFTAKTGIRILASAPQELTIDPQNFVGVTTEIDDQRVNPSRAFQFNIGAKMAAESTDQFVQTIANGGLMRQVYAVKIPKESWRTAGTTQQVRIGSTPVRARIVGCFCDTTVAFAGLAGTIQLSVGSAAGTPADMIAAHDVKSGVVTKGLADADLGSLLARATAVQGGGGNWSAGNDIYAQLISGTGNLGNGTVTNLTNGEVKIYVVMEVMP